MSSTHRILLLPCKLAGRLEVDSEVGELSLVVLADVLNGVHMERHREPIDRQNDGLRLAIDEDLVKA